MRLTARKRTKTGKNKLIWNTLDYIALTYLANCKLERKARVSLYK